MPFKGEHDLDFPKAGRHNVMLVFGDNMRGKTSVLNGIRWALHGTALDRHGGEIPLRNLVNLDAAGEGDWTMASHLQFTHDAHDYDLRRAVAKRRLVTEPRSTSDFETSLSLLKDGHAVRADLIEKEIAQIVPEQISRFFLFDGELLQEYETLLMEGNKQGERIRDAIEQVLGVPTLLHGRDELRTILKQAQREQTRDLAQVTSLRGYAEKQAELQAKMTSYERDMQTLKENRQRLDDEIRALQQEVDASENAYRQKLELDSVLKSHKEAAEREKECVTRKMQLVGEAWKDLLDIRVQERRAQLEAERDAHAERARTRGMLEEQIRSLKALLGTSECPTCTQTIGEGLRTQVGAKLGLIEGELADIRRLVSQMSASSEELAQLQRLRGTGAEASLTAANRDLERVRIEMTRLENDRERLREVLRGFDTADVARKRALLGQLQKNAGRLQGEIENLQTAMDKNKRDQDTASRQMAGSAQARSHKSSKMVELSMSLEKVFGESIDRLRDELRVKVQDLATTAFLRLTTQASYKHLEIGPNYGLTIVDGHGRKVNLRSAGAEQIVALALIDGLNRLARTTGPIVMDTPLARLDPKHRQNMLAYLPDMANQVTLLVHEGELRRDADLGPIGERIGAVYNIEHISSSRSRFVRV